MKISKWGIFFSGFILIVVFITTPRLLWLKRSLRAKAAVAAVNKTRYTEVSQTYPVLIYHTGKNEVVTTGNYNLPFKVGDTISIRYHPANLYNVKIDSFMGCWIDKLMWLVPLLFIWTVLFIPNDFRPYIQVKKGKINLRFFSAKSE